MSVYIATLLHVLNQLGLVFHVDFVQRPSCLLELVHGKGRLILDVVLAVIGAGAGHHMLAQGR